jgi:hypothetical protein
MPVAPHTVDSKFRYPLLFAHHRDTESTERAIILPDRRQPARHREASAEAGGSPGQGKNNILCVLCASAVNLQSGSLRPLPQGAE